MIKKQKGFSLIEIMMSLLVFSIMIIITSRILVVTQSTNSLINSQIKLNNISRSTEEKISNHLSKALYIVPGNNNILPDPVKNDSFKFKANQDNFVTLPTSVDSSSPISNGICFLSHRKYILASDIFNGLLPNYDRPTQGSIGGIIGSITVSDLNTAKSNVEVSNSKVQLVDYNCFYLTTKNLTSEKKGKNPKNRGSLQIAFFNQKGFYNSNSSSIQWPANSSMSPKDQSTIDTNTLILNKALMYLNFTPLKIPAVSDPYTPELSGFTLDNDLNFPSISSEYNSTISIFSDNIGAVAPYTGTPPSFHKQDKYVSDLDFNDSNNLPNKFNPIDLGFRLKTNSKLSSSELLSITIDLNLSYYDEFLRKNVSSFRSFTVKPNIISY